MARIQIGRNGRIVIPIKFRRAIGIEPEDNLVLRIEEGELRISTRRHRARRAQDIVRQSIIGNVSLSRQLIADRRAEAKRERNDSRRIKPGVKINVIR